MDESQNNGGSSVNQLAKGLIRYALACEYARKPIKRQDVNERGMKMISDSTRQY